MLTCQSGVQKAVTSVITETKLAMASRHVAKGRRVVERQRALIASQRKAGLNTSAAEKLLDLFETTRPSSRMIFGPPNAKKIQTETLPV
jgi:hypothetical protein